MKFWPKSVCEGENVRDGSQSTTADKIAEMEKRLNDESNSPFSQDASRFTTEPFFAQFSSNFSRLLFPLPGSPHGADR